MNWTFALVNNKLAEVFFEKKKEKIIFLGHCYVKTSEYKTKKEKHWIQEDTKRVKLAYRKGKYREKLAGMAFFGELNCNISQRNSNYHQGCRNLSISNEIPKSLWSHLDFLSR